MKKLLYIKGLMLKLNPPRARYPEVKGSNSIIPRTCDFSNQISKYILQKTYLQKTMEYYSFCLIHDLDKRWFFMSFTYK